MRKRAPAIDEQQAKRSKRAPRKSSNMSPRGDQIEAKMSPKCIPKGSLEASGRALGSEADV